MCPAAGRRAPQRADSSGEKEERGSTGQAATTIVEQEVPPVWNPGARSAGRLRLRLQVRRPLTAPPALRLVQMVSHFMARQQRDKHHALSRTRIDDERSTTLFDDQLDDHQAGAQTSRAGRDRPVEQLEGLGPLNSPHASSAVRDSQFVTVCQSGRSRIDARLSLGGIAIPHRVRNQIVKDRPRPGGENPVIGMAVEQLGVPVRQA
jgi:hypothetical protein